MNAIETKNRLAQYGLTPNKALGQNFLTDEAGLTCLAASAVKGGLPVLEIGPGLGALTEALLHAGAPRVWAVEKDAAMAEALEKLLPDARQTVITGDFLRVKLPELPLRFSAAGNLPYYATTPIVERLFALRPERITLTVQREAAERFFAGPSERVYGPMAVTAQLCYTPERLCELPAASFYPQPEVDSCAVGLTLRADCPFAPRALYGFLKRAFATRRKTLVNSLPDKARTLDALTQLSLPADARAEALPPEIWARLYPLLDGRE